MRDGKTLEAIGFIETIGTIQVKCKLTSSTHSKSMSMGTIYDTQDKGDKTCKW